MWQVAFAVMLVVACHPACAQWGWDEPTKVVHVATTPQAPPTLPPLPSWTQHELCPTCRRPASRQQPTRNTEDSFVVRRLPGPDVGVIPNTIEQWRRHLIVDHNVPAKYVNRMTFAQLRVVHANRHNHPNANWHGF